MSNGPPHSTSFISSIDEKVNTSTENSFHHSTGTKLTAHKITISDNLYDTLGESRDLVESISNVPFHETNKESAVLKTSESTVANDIESTTTKYGKASTTALDNSEILNSYEDTKDKSTEEILNDLIKLMDEMTKKYHNNASLVIQ